MTLMQLAMSKSNWHFDPAIKSIDFREIGNVTISNREVDDFLLRLEQEQALKLKTLGGRKSKYGSQADINELDQWGYEDNIEFLSIAEIKTTSLSFIPELIKVLPLRKPHFELMIQRPGQMLPLHIDMYNAYRRNTNLEINQISRYLVALSNWDWGHYFNVGNSIWHQWQAGDIITWSPFMYHASANCGRKNKITMSITGITCISE
ncbi:hypothetical protein HBO24_14055 [Pseudomonas sp. WS 5410]|nr:hypothetical protein [Pseudomonas sp. WS 5410]